MAKPPTPLATTRETRATQWLPNLQFVLQHFSRRHSTTRLPRFFQKSNMIPIGTLVIGKNEGWKQEIAIGSRNNQNFVQVPHARFIDQITYKTELVGIKVIVNEESYTS
ncbi:MAG: IS200/IS605 family accessory protein TnpB-related protein [Nostoc sp.]